MPPSALQRTGLSLRGYREDNSEDLLNVHSAYPGTVLRAWVALSEYDQGYCYYPYFANEVQYLAPGRRSVVCCGKCSMNLGAVTPKVVILIALCNHSCSLLLSSIQLQDRRSYNLERERRQREGRKNSILLYVCPYVLFWPVNSPIQIISCLPTPLLAFGHKCMHLFIHLLISSFSKQFLKACYEPNGIPGTRRLQWWIR